MQVPLSQSVSLVDTSFFQTLSFLGLKKLRLLHRSRRQQHGPPESYPGPLSVPMRLQDSGKHQHC